jgi:hypothetical protein
MIKNPMGMMLSITHMGIFINSSSSAASYSSATKVKEA